MLGQTIYGWDLKILYRDLKSKKKKGWKKLNRIKWFIRLEKKNWLE